MNTQFKKQLPAAEICTVEEITPELAYKWLERNTHNRKINETTVERYAEDMRQGRWKLTHQGIAFDVNGTLIDGQHRLWAVALSKTPVMMRIFRNIPTDTMDCVDTGKQRSHLDVIKLTGAFEGVTVDHLAILRAMFRRSLSSNRPESVGFEAELLKKHRDALEFVLTHFYKGRIAKITTAVVGAVIARAYYSCDRNKLSRFCEVMRSGIANGPKEYAGALLARYLLRDAGGAKADRQAKYGKIERAVLAFVRDEPLSKLVEYKGEIFPLPEERKQK